MSGDSVDTSISDALAPEDVRRALLAVMRSCAARRCPIPALNRLTEVLGVSRSCVYRTMGQLGAEGEVRLTKNLRGRIFAVFPKPKPAAEVRP